MAGFWILDGLLQLQPAMFTMAMIQSVMQPETTGQPVWMQEIVRWVIAVLSWNLPLANGLIGGIQLLLGAALLWRGRERTWPDGGVDGSWQKQPGPGAAGPWALGQQTDLGRLSRGHGHRASVAHQQQPCA